MTSEELATILREELPGWEVVAHPPSYHSTAPYATAKRGDWEVQMIGPNGDECDYTLIILTPPQPDCMCDDMCNQIAERAPIGETPLENAREGLRKAVTGARLWVAALQAGCP